MRLRVLNQSGVFFYVTGIRDRRFVALDPERGIAFAFAFFGLEHLGRCDVRPAAPAVIRGYIKLGRNAGARLAAWGYSDSLLR